MNPILPEELNMQSFDDDDFELYRTMLKLREELYQSILQKMNEPPIQSNAKNPNLTHEYRAAISTTLNDYAYLSVKIFKNKTGESNFKEYSEFMGKGELTRNESKRLTKRDTKDIIERIAKYNFWQLPSSQRIILNGCILFLEGFHANKHNLISACMPHNEIAEIYNVILIWHRREIR